MKDMLRNLTSAVLRRGGGGADLNRPRAFCPARVSGERHGECWSAGWLPVLIVLCRAAAGALVLHPVCAAARHARQDVITWLSAVFVVGYWTWRLVGGVWL